MWRGDMKASELRIGNMIYVERFGINIVATIESGYDIDEVGHTKLSSQGIPLTEEWLMKFGFEQRSGITIWMKTIQYHDENYPVTLQFTNNGTAMQIARSGIGSACAPCKYVHQ